MIDLTLTKCINIRNYPHLFPCLLTMIDLIQFHYFYGDKYSSLFICLITLVFCHPFYSKFKSEFKVFSFRHLPNFIWNDC